MVAWASMAGADAISQRADVAIGGLSLTMHVLKAGAGQGGGREHCVSIKFAGRF
jgi:hypothetical protein